MLLRLAYTIFIGILFAVFVGAGIAAFYPQPRYPEYPVELSKPYPPKEGSTESATLNAEQVKYERKSREFQKISETYNKNVSIISLIAAVVLVIVGLILSKMLQVISDGLLLGGVATLLYSIVRGFGANDDIFRFVIVSVSLAIALLIGYIKFVSSSKLPR